MKRAALLSAILHLFILGLLIFGLPWLPHRSLDMPQPIAVAMVPIGEVTTMTAPKPKPQEEKKPEKEKPKPSKPEEKPKPEQKEPPKPEQPKVEPKPEVTPEPKPAPKEEPKPRVKPEKKEPKVEKKPEKVEKKAEKKQEKPKKEKQPEKKETQEDFLSVLKNLKKSSSSDDADETSKSDATESMNRGVLSDTLTMSELDALRRQIAGCWSIPAGIQQAEDLAVEIAVSVNPDMTVREAKIIDMRRMGSDPHFRVAAESALRAVLHPNCSPLKLPPKKYQQWKDFTFVFNPKDML